RRCDNPEAAAVNTLAVWTLALARLGGRPMLRRKVFEVTPYAMPREPSTSWATNPIAAHRMRVVRSSSITAKPLYRGLASTFPWKRQPQPPRQGGIIPSHPQKYATRHAGGYGPVWRVCGPPPAT